MTPGMIQENFIPVGLETLEIIALEKNKNADQRFLYEAFKAFLPLELQISGFGKEGLVDDVLTALEYDMYYCIVDLNGEQLFIGLLHYLEGNKIYVFNARSINGPSSCQVTLSSVFRNSDFFTIKVLLNLIVSSLEL